MAYGVPPLDLDRVRDGDQDATADALYSLWLAYNQAAVRSQRAASLDAPPTFTTSPVIIDGPTPSLVFYDSTQGTDLKAFRIIDETQQLKFQVNTDLPGLSPQIAALLLTRAGDAQVGRNLTALGSGGNVVCKDQNNTITATPQTVSASNPTILVIDTNASVPANAKRWALWSSAQLFLLDAQDDTGVTQVRALSVNRSGDVVIGRDVYEKGRTTPMGHWIAVAYNAANFGSGGGVTWTVDAADVVSNAYTLVGRTMTWNLILNTTTLAGAGNQLRVVLPGGFTIQVWAIQLVSLLDNGVATSAIVLAQPGLQYIQIMRSDSGNFTASTNNTTLRVMATIQI